jgi:hypothetical protein
MQSTKWSAWPSAVALIEPKLGDPVDRACPFAAVGNRANEGVRTLQCPRESFIPGTGPRCRRTARSSRRGPSGSMSSSASASNGAAGSSPQILRRKPNQDGPKSSIRSASNCFKLLQNDLFTPVHLSMLLTEDLQDQIRVSLITSLEPAIPPPGTTDHHPFLR